MIWNFESKPRSIPNGLKCSDGSSISLTYDRIFIQGSLPIPALSAVMGCDLANRFIGILQAHFFQTVREINSTFRCDARSACADRCIRVVAEPLQPGTKILHIFFSRKIEQKIQSFHWIWGDQHPAETDICVTQIATFENHFANLSDFRIGIVQRFEQIIRTDDRLVRSIFLDRANCQEGCPANAKAPDRQARQPLRKEGSFHLSSLLR